MSENQTLLFVLALLYLTECITLARTDTLFFLSPLLRRWKVVYPATLFGSTQSGLVFSNPLPPLGVTVTCQPWPVSLSPVGAYSYISLTIHPEGRLDQEEAYIAWDNIREVSLYGSRLRINRTDFVKVGSAQLAKLLASMIDHLKRLPAKERGEVIRQAIQKSLDAETVRARIGEYLRKSWWLRVLSNLLFLYLFVVAPCMIWYFDLPRTWVLLLVGLILIMILNSFLFFRSHKALCPTESGERMQNLFLISLLPTLSLRAHDYLARHLLMGFHPLAVAHALCSAEDFNAVAKRMILDARHPMQPVCPSEEAGPRETESWYRESQRSAMEEFVQSVGVDLTILTRPPASGETISKSYCPRCHLEYAMPEGNCDRCGGMSLLQIGEA